MPLKKNIAAALRVARTIRGLNVNQLDKACSSRTIERIEAGTINAPLDTLFALANALDIDLATLMVLCIASHENEHPNVTLSRITAEINTVLAVGGDILLKEQFTGDDLVQRSKGKPKNEDQFLEVMKRKASGCTASDVIKELGLPRSTVYNYWKRLS